MPDSPVRSAAASPDIELAGRAVAGDRVAFGELARRHVAAVRLQLRRMGADAESADRLAQDAFLVAFGRLEDLRGQGPFSGWIKRIATRLYVKRWLKGSRLPAATETLRPYWGAVRLARPPNLDDALTTLSEAERLCTTIGFGGGLSHAESARTLGAPIATVKAHVRAGARKLRTALESGADESPADFDRRLHRLYAAADPAPDAQLFARRLEHRLDRAWARRRLAIALAGAASAAVAAWSLTATAAAIQLEDAIRSPLVWSAHKLGHWVAGIPLLRTLPYSGQVAWMLAGLVLLAAGLIATRVFDD